MSLSRATKPTTEDTMNLTSAATDILNEIQENIAIKKKKDLISRLANRLQEMLSGINEIEDVLVVVDLRAGEPQNVQISGLPPGGNVRVVFTECPEVADVDDDSAVYLDPDRVILSVVTPEYEDNNSDLLDLLDDYNNS